MGAASSERLDTCPRVEVGTVGWRWAMAMAADTGGRDGVTGGRGRAAAAARVLDTAAGDERLGRRGARISGEGSARGDGVRAGGLTSRSCDVATASTNLRS